jgi:hypothetical protein
MTLLSDVFTLVGLMEKNIISLVLARSPWCS